MAQNKAKTAPDSDPVFLEFKAEVLGMQVLAQAIGGIPAAAAAQNYAERLAGVAGETSENRLAMLELKVEALDRRRTIALNGE